MTLEISLFILFSAIASVSAVLVITRRNPIISAIFLIVNMVSLAGLYLLLNAQFIAVAQVIVYAGAIMVLFLFVLMLLLPEQERKILKVNPIIKTFAIGIAILVFLQIAFMIFVGSPSENLSPDVAASVEAGTIEQIGRELYTNYIVPFQAAGFLLLAATIGAVVLAKKKFE